MESSDENLENLFNSKGFTNSLLADFFLQLGTQVQNNPSELNEKLPKPLISRSDEFQNAYSLVIKYLQHKNMVKTEQALHVYSQQSNSKSIETLIHDFKLEENSNPLNELIHKQKIRNLLNPEKIDDFFQ